MSHPAISKTVALNLAGLKINARMFGETPQLYSEALQKWRDVAENYVMPCGQIITREQLANVIKGKI